MGAGNEALLRQRSNARPPPAQPRNSLVWDHGVDDGNLQPVDKILEELDTLVAYVSEFFSGLPEQARLHLFEAQHNVKRSRGLNLFFALCIKTRFPFHQARTKSIFSICVEHYKKDQDIYMQVRSGRGAA